MIYRRFTYKPKLSMGSKGFLSVFLLSAGVFLTIPTPEDIVILGALGRYISQAFDMSTGKGILYATLVYKGAGVTMLVIAAVLGGSYIRERLKSQVKNQVRKITKFCT